MQEEWKKITFQEGLDHYEVSNLGHVRVLPRDVRTRVVNHGKEMYVIAHRKGRDVTIQYEKGRPLVRLYSSFGVRLKLSLGLLMLRTFTECPGDISEYTSGYIDNDTTNNKLDNLMWVPKRVLMTTVSNNCKGESRPDLMKYSNIIIKVHNQVVGYFANIKEGVELFNSYGFNTSVPSLTNAYKNRSKYYYIFDLVSVSDEVYKDTSMKYAQLDLRIIYDIVMFDRKSRGYEEPRSIYEKDKEEKKRLANSSTTNVKEKKNKEIKTRKTTLDPKVRVLSKDELMQKLMDKMFS